MVNCIAEEGMISEATKTFLKDIFSLAVYNFASFLVHNSWFETVVRASPASSQAATSH